MSLGAWPLDARSQQQALLSIGFIHSASPNYFAPFAKDFHAGLKEAGYVEGQNVTIASRWAEGHYERLPALVADLLGRNVSVIFAAGGTDPAKAAKAATSTTPIVFVSAADPVRIGLVESLNRPGANVTGVSSLLLHSTARSSISCVSWYRRHQYSLPFSIRITRTLRYRAINFRQPRPS